MPPMRTPLPTSSKLNIPIKTERSHEENQERAYIAASRRSDRSLEARVESARRASEIHKKRTGRSLRVTEQDVINEEMYEEEDDDLPLQYRRMTAHLQTNSSDFNRRLSAYLTSHQAMRNALSQALSNSYAQSANQQPQQQTSQQDQPQFPFHSQPFNLTLPTRKSPSTSPAAQSATNQANSPTTTQQHSFANFRQAPYPLSTQSSYHQRSSSFNAGPAQSRRQDSFSTPHTDTTSLIKLAEADELKQTTGNTVFPQPAGNPIWDQNNDLGPFSTNLPNDARMFLDNEALSQQYLGPASFEKPSLDTSLGMDQTLAPTALDKNTWDEPASAVTEDDSLSPDAFRSNFDSELGHGFGGNSGAVSPGEDMWKFIDDSAY